MSKIKFVRARGPMFMDSVHDVIQENPWIKYVVSVDLELQEHNGSILTALQNSEAVREWVEKNAEGKYIRVGKSRSYGFELESDIVLFHLTWGKG